MVAPVSDAKVHITICICTYKRPASLLRLLEKIAGLDTGNLFSYSIVVADNDKWESGKSVISLFAATSPVPITYCVEPRQNIALARNKAIEEARGSFVAFIDDDEFPSRDWLLTLFRACQNYQVAGVVGPVKRHFDHEPPRWIVRGHFYERQSYPTGLVIDWSKGRTNNVLMRTEVLPPGAQVFRPEFRTGEDQDLFRRMIGAGHSFVWCNEAVVYEVVPPVRWQRTFMLRRAVLQGTAAVLHPSFGAREIAKSIIAIPIYLAVLPFYLFAHHRFMTIMIKLCDHIGRVLAVMNINPIKEPYVTD